VFTVAVPYHLDERIPGFATGRPADREVTAELPPGDPWSRMAVLYERVAQAVVASPEPPLVVSGDCTTSLGVLAGLQRAGQDVGIVWFDAHADFHTEQTTTSGYLGGMPLAIAVGLGPASVPRALALRAVPEERVLLVDARDTDPGEHVLLANSRVVRCAVPEVTEDALPPGPLYLHVDADTCDPADVPGLLYPAPNGPARADVLAAIALIAGTGRVAAVGVGATWRHEPRTSTEHAALLADIVAAVSG
jgi:arginase